MKQPIFLQCTLIHWLHHWHSPSHWWTFFCGGSAIWQTESCESSSRWFFLEGWNWNNISNPSLNLWTLSCHFLELLVASNDLRFDVANCNAWITSSKSAGRSSSSRRAYHSAFGAIISALVDSCSRESFASQTSAFNSVSWLLIKVMLSLCLWMSLLLSQCQWERLSTL